MTFDMSSININNVIIFIGRRNTGARERMYQKQEIAEIELYGRLLVLNECKKEMWKKDGIGQGLAEHFGHPKRIKLL